MLEVMSYLPPSPPNPKSSDFKTDLKTMWATRPVRIPRDMGHRAKVAGVCEGIGVRYQVDPTIVRVVFIVATIFAGAGFPAYFLAWAFMPRYGSARSPLEQLFNMNVKTTWAPIAEKDERFSAIFLLVLIFFTSGSGSLGTGLTWTGVIFLWIGWWLLHSARPVAPMNLLVPTKDNAAFITGAPADLSAYGIFDPRVNQGYFIRSEEYQPNNLADTFGQSPFAAEAPRDPRTPPAWDPLGAAPFAWDLPEPGPAPSQATAKEKSKIWPWVVGGALFTGTVLTVVAAASWPTYWNFAQGDEDQGSYETEYDSGFDPEAGFNDPILDDLDFSKATRIKVNEHVNLGSEYLTGHSGLVLDLSDLDASQDDHHLYVQGGEGPTRVILPANAPVLVNCQDVHNTPSMYRCPEGGYNLPADGSGAKIHLELSRGRGPFDVISAEKAEFLREQAAEKSSEDDPSPSPVDESEGELLNVG